MQNKFVILIYMLHPRKTSENNKKITGKLWIWVAH